MQVSTDTFGGKPYNDYGSWIRHRFPYRVQKISVDAGFSCPNRDGRVSVGGCSFCDNRTFSPAYCGRGKSIAAQIKEGKEFSTCTGGYDRILSCKLNADSAIP